MLGLNGIKGLHLARKRESASVSTRNKKLIVLKILAIFSTELLLGNIN